MNTLTETPTDTVSLYYREGSSDKVYQCAIEPAGDDRYSVTFAYGRRGGTLSTAAATARHEGSTNQSCSPSPRSPKALKPQQ